MFSFTVSGHKNIRAEHRSTIEFTKDCHVTPQGDCIVGVSANFSLEALREFSGKKQVTITLTNSGGEFIVHARPHKEFCDENEMVVRTSDFASERTFAVRADKAAKDIPRKMIEKLQAGEKMEVRIE